MDCWVKIFVLIFIFSSGISQNKLEFDGQVSAISSFSPKTELNTFIGGRYIPQLFYTLDLDSTQKLDFEVSTNISASSIFKPFIKDLSTANISPYRIWARYSSAQFEFRIGLQKIDFGSASLLRPLQWFNQIDPRDPLQLTNGVYGVMSKYVFLNNANIWLWALYGNKKTRGFDVIETNNKLPEIGGRFQYPVPRGEIAISYHYRKATSSGLTNIPIFEKIPESRLALDGKWDLGVGLWFETSFVHKYKDLQNITNQTLFNIGTDYTFGVGNGLNVIAEHLLTSYDQLPFRFNQTQNITAFTANYPISLFDNLSSVLYYSWTTGSMVSLLNYQHQFDKITGYLMAYYNPATVQGIQQNELFNNFQGPGIRIVLVYNH